MSTPPRTRTIGRLSEIAQVMVRHGFGYFFEAHKLSDLLPGRSAEERLANAAAGPGAASTRGQHLRDVLDELGPTFVKFGQLLSTRPDVVPPDIVLELRALQDDVRPFAFEDVRRVIEAELGNTLERLFTEFDPVPVAAASIGQVHRATLPNGRRVAVKVQRPGAARQVEADIVLLFQAARLAQERIRALDFIDANQLVDEFARSIRKELDYRLEGRNAQMFHRDFAGIERVRVPKVYWSYSGTRVLTLEWIDGVQLADLDLAAMGLDERRDLAYRITETWMRMIFRNGLFHADPHPANILITPDGTIGLIDFGSAGKLTDDDMSKLTGLFIDAANENIDQIPRRLWDLGVRYPREREDELRAELRELYYRYYGANLSEIDPIQAVREGFALMYALNMRLPTRFLLLDRAIATLGSVGQELYPDFNVFEVARPYARDLMLARFTPERVARRARREAIRYAQVLAEAPHQFHGFMEEIRDGQIEVGFVHKGLDDLLAKLDTLFNRIVIALVVVGGLIGSSLIGIFAKGGPHVLGVNVLSIVGLGVSALLGVWLLWGVVRSGRL
ncbi:MAG: ubiquinone biosynthesis protein [Gaiellaceae bacterium]|jgi:ubiquinone biosynthesis protein|nr:ubiquinone biosynthesis protein [Gaiellaceae bacterium]